MSFIHLGIHSEYSISDSIIRIKELVKQAAQYNMPALALTDLGNVFASVKFYNQCLDHGIKPILGAEIRIAGETPAVITLLAENNTGWKNLLALLSQTYIEGQHLGVAYAQTEWIEAHAEGLLLLLGANSPVGQLLLSNQPELATPRLQHWLTFFSNRTYLTVSRTGKPEEDTWIEKACGISRALHIGLVATNDVRFMHTDDFLAHEARVCIAEGQVLAAENRISRYTEDQYFKDDAEMTALFADIPAAITNTLEIAKRCNVILELGHNYLPNYPVTEGMTMADFFHEICHKGLQQRLSQLYPTSTRAANWAETEQLYIDRLNFEINTILSMGFPGYFLIVMDFIGWAKDHQIPVGPGRGSGAGSLVAYSLKITDLDPLRYDLLFERFLNPERVSMPDFDVDFCVAGRDRVIEYVAERYGRDAVSQIITFGTMAAKAVVKDVARVLGKPYGLADKISKLIPKTPGISLKEALAEEPQLQQIIQNPQHSDHEDATEIWEMALKLEGVTRNVGKHAGGVLIAPGKISDFSAVYCDEEGARVSQFDKDDVEKVGLVKFDFLGLRNLTVIDMAMRDINARRQQEGLPTLDLTELPLDDKPTYDLLQATKTTAVFQLESAGMRKYLGRLKPTNIDDIIAMCALYRPGPLDAGMVDMYIDRKHGREKVEYDHPDLEPILKSTNGVIVYQEQVMQIAQVLAGYTLGGADMLRRAMGKKKPEEMEKQRQIFVEGAKNRGIEADISGGIFDLMEKFAGYGFNKSHSAAYGIVAYQTAYLKTHYPAEFMAAVLTSEMHNTDNIVGLIDDCRGLGLTIMPPSVNHSVFSFTAKDAHTIVYGLGAIKGVGESAMESAIQARAAGEPFKDLFDFCHRIDLKKANKRTLESLIRAGAMDIFGEDRASLLEQLADAIGAAEQARENRDSGIMDLFGEVTSVQKKPVSRREWVMSDEDRLQGEKETLGLYLTGHPIDIYLAELKSITGNRLNTIPTTKRGETTLIAGLVFEIINFNTRYAIRIDDGSARIELTLSPKLFDEKYQHIITTGDIVVFEVECYTREGFDTPSIRMHRAFSLEHIRERRAAHVEITLPAIDLFREDKTPVHHELEDCIPLLHQLCKQPAAQEHIKLPLVFTCTNSYGTATLTFPASYWIIPTNQTLRALRHFFGKNNVQVSYHKKRV